MKAIGMLMVEHRLIERMVKLLAKELKSEEIAHSANPSFIMAATDFFTEYADKVHHGKEEGILFRELSKKPLTDAQKATMARLVDEHAVARREVQRLTQATEMYERGDMGSIMHIMSSLRRLVALYPPHIKLEESDFFLAVIPYFSEDEKGLMHAECVKFDEDAMHEKYKAMVEMHEVK